MSAAALPLPTAPADGHRSPRPARHLRIVEPPHVPARAAGGAGARRPVDAPAARPGIRLTARGRLARSLLVLVTAGALAGAGGGWLGGRLADAQSYTGPVERVSVGAGDTVWAIAAAAATDGQDVRAVVDDLLRLNGLASGDLVLGQQLLVPAE